MAGANSPKYRDYFITANQGAECYEKLQDIILSLKYERYAWIIHDKDFEVLEDGTLRPKKTHKHLCLELTNPLSFNSIQKKFAGAHIEAMKLKQASYQYLIHNRPNAKEKYQYSLDEIITNDPNGLKALMEREIKEVFNPDRVFFYMARGIYTSIQFLNVFGYETWKREWKDYDRLARDARADTEGQELIKQAFDTLNDELPF